MCRACRERVPDGRRRREGGDATERGQVVRRLTPDRGTMRRGAAVPVWALVVAAALAAVRAQSDCPPRCLCFRTTVRCMFLGLRQLPQVPEATTIL